MTDARKLAELVATTANELDQTFRQRHRMSEVEAILRRFLRQAVEGAEAAPQTAVVAARQMANLEMLAHEICPHAGFDETRSRAKKILARVIGEYVPPSKAPA